MEQELEKGKEGTETAEEANMQGLKELEFTNRIIEELKLKLEKAEAEERRAKQDSELAKRTLMEMEEQGTADMDTVTRGEQLEDETVESELKVVKEEMDDLQKKYASLLSEKDVALKRVEETLSKSKEIEKTVEEIKVELVSTKETLESARLHAEEKRNAAAMSGEKELQHGEVDMEKLNQIVEAEKDLKGKLNTTSNMLASLKSELSTYKEFSNDEMQTEVVEAENELQGLKLKTEKTRDDTKSLKVASVTLKRELKHEKSELTSVKQREGVLSANVASLEAELDKVKSKINAVYSREKEAKDRMTELPKQLEVASQEAGDAKSAAESAREGLRKVKEEAEPASTLERRVLSVQKEIEAAKASEKLAMAAIKESMDTQNQVIVPLEEYNELSKRAQEAEEQANIKAADILARVEAAKEAEMKILSKLEEANQELLTRKEVYAHAANKVEKESEAKLFVEEELRRWSDENEQRRGNGDGAFDSPSGGIEGQDSHAPYEQGQAADPSQNVTNSKESTGSDSPNSTSPRQQEQANSTDASADTKAETKKKKKHFFPHIFLLFSKKKASSHTS